MPTRSFTIRAKDVEDLGKKFYDAFSSIEIGSEEEPDIAMSNCAGLVYMVMNEAHRMGDEFPPAIYEIIATVWARTDPTRGSIRGSFSLTYVEHGRSTE